MTRNERVESIKRDEEDCPCRAKELWKEPCDIGFLLSEIDRLRAENEKATMILKDILASINDDLRHLTEAIKEGK